MNAAIKINPQRLPAPKLPPTPSIRPEPIPDGIPVVTIPIFAPPKPEAKKAPQPKPGRPKKESALWPNKRVNCLIALYNEGKEEKEIAAEMGIRPAQVKSRLCRLRNEGRIGKRTPKGYWTEEEDERLISIYREGRTAEEIAEALGRTVHACESRIYKLRHTGKLPDPIRANLSARVNRRRGNG